MTLQGFVDESFAGAYIVAAVVVPTTEVNAARAAMRGVLRPGQRRIHFKDERAARKDQVLGAVGSLALAATVYVTKNDRNALRAHAELLLCLPDAVAWCWAKGGRWRDRVSTFTREVPL